jgi:ribosomal protein S28E/S33
MKHGRGRYVNYGCRCAICREATRIAVRVYHIDRKARGLCRSCKRPVDVGNVTYCARHRATERERQARARLGKEPEARAA